MKTKKLSRILTLNGKLEIPTYKELCRIALPSLPSKTPLIPLIPLVSKEKEKNKGDGKDTKDVKPQNDITNFTKEELEQAGI